jgi:hypothetical protein
MFKHVCDTAFSFLFPFIACSPKDISSARRQLEAAGSLGSNTDLVIVLRCTAKAVNREVPVAPLVAPERCNACWARNANPDELAVEDAIWQSYPREIPDEIEVGYRRLISEESVEF